MIVIADEFKNISIDAFLDYFISFYFISFHFIILHYLIASH